METIQEYEHSSWRIIKTVVPKPDCVTTKKRGEKRIPHPTLLPTESLEKKPRIYVLLKAFVAILIPFQVCEPLAFT